SGELIEDRVYNNADYDYNIVIEDRAREVAEEITRYLRSTDRLAKTIVFCPTEDAAERMRQALVNANSDMVREHPDYVVRITGSDEYGKGKLDYFISVAEPFPTIATTSKLLTTGVDCKMTKLIVLDSCISSMTEFKQIIGRGTRIREKDGKTHFVVMDFRNVTRLFADPDWDGPIEIDEGFQPGQSEKVERDPDEDGDERDEQSKEKKAKPIVGPDGCRVEVIYKTVSVYDVDGKLLRQESVVDYARANLLGEYASLDDFIQNGARRRKRKRFVK
ncbi:MAG: restriction endonuclease, partial [Thermoguttaceae bacterium]|nr:restriction endonuclease [Thermoguttaceae bacterium]